MAKKPKPTKPPPSQNPAPRPIAPGREGVAIVTFLPDNSNSAFQRIDYTVDLKRDPSGTSINGSLQATLEGQPITIIVLVFSKGGSWYVKWGWKNVQNGPSNTDYVWIGPIECPTIPGATTNAGTARAPITAAGTNVTFGPNTHSTVAVVVPN
jgi:hypothetical protein